MRAAAQGSRAHTLAARAASASHAAVGSKAATADTHMVILVMAVINRGMRFGRPCSFTQAAAASCWLPEPRDQSAVPQDAAAIATRSNAPCTPRLAARHALLPAQPDDNNRAGCVTDMQSTVKRQLTASGCCAFYDELRLSLKSYFLPVSLPQVLWSRHGLSAAEPTVNPKP